MQAQKSKHCTTVNICLVICQRGLWKSDSEYKNKNYILVWIIC